MSDCIAVTEKNDDDISDRYDESGDEDSYDELDHNDDEDHHFDVDKLCIFI